MALFAHALLDVLAEALQVAVYGRRAVVQREVDGAPVAVGAQAYARDVAVGHGHEGFAFGAVRAAEWLVAADRKGMFSMPDLLGF